MEQGIPLTSNWLQTYKAKGFLDLVVPICSDYKGTYSLPTTISVNCIKWEVFSTNISCLYRILGSINCGTKVNLRSFS